MSHEPNHYGKLYRKLALENRASSKHFHDKPGGDLIMSSVQLPKLSFADAEKISEECQMLMFGRSHGPEEWVVWMFYHEYSRVNVWLTLPDGVLTKPYCEYVWDKPAHVTLLTQRLKPGLSIGLSPKSNNGDLVVEINIFGPPPKLN